MKREDHGIPAVGDTEAPGPRSRRARKLRITVHCLKVAGFDAGPPVAAQVTRFVRGGSHGIGRPWYAYKKVAFEEASERLPMGLISQVDKSVHAANPIRGLRRRVTSRDLRPSSSRSSRTGTLDVSRYELKTSNEDRSWIKQ